MPGDDFTFAARSLALPIHDDSDDEPIFSPQQASRHSTEHTWSRRPLSATGERRARTVRGKWMQTAGTLHRRYMKTWNHFSNLQKAVIVTLVLVFLVLMILFLVYNESIFAWLSPAAKRWRNLPAGWLILWVMAFAVAFPPMIGYSTCVTIAGFVFGMKGWFIVSTATVAGSTCAFVVSRTALRSFVSRLTEKNTRFAALSLVLKHDGLKLLVMIRLCPLPYSLSNGAISTIPTVSWQNFAIATAIASPKLLLHVFVGSQLGDLAEHGDKMDVKTKIVSYVSIAIGVAAGIGTGYFVYVRTKARAKQLEAEEAAAAVRGGRTSNAGSDFIDDPNEREAVGALRRENDGLSLHATYEGDLEGGRSYTDEFSDGGESDAHERDAFEIGDGEDEDVDKKDSL